MRYETLKSKHLCICCYKQDERTLAGYTTCQKCTDKAKNRKDKQMAYRKANHLCTVCGAALEKDDKHVRCLECREKEKKRRYI